MPTMKVKPPKPPKTHKQQFSIWATDETLRCLDKLIDYDLIRNRSDAVAHAAKIAAEQKEKS